MLCLFGGFIVCLLDYLCVSVVVAFVFGSFLFLTGCCCVLKGVLGGRLADFLLSRQTNQPDCLINWLKMLGFNYCLFVCLIVFLLFDY